MLLDEHVIWRGKQDPENIFEVGEITIHFNADGIEEGEDKSKWKIE